MELSDTISNVPKKLLIQPLWDKDMISVVKENIDVFFSSLEDDNNLLRGLVSLPTDFEHPILLKIIINPMIYNIINDLNLEVPSIIIDRLIVLNRLHKPNTLNWPMDPWYGQLFRSLRKLWDFENKFELKHKYPLDVWGLLDEEPNKIPISRSIAKKLILLQ